MCIRALDYCPPVDITFGDYLRALITADVDLVPGDEHHYRVAIIEAFRPTRTLSAQFADSFRTIVALAVGRSARHRGSKSDLGAGRQSSSGWPSAVIITNRDSKTFRILARVSGRIHDLLTPKIGRKILGNLEEITGLLLSPKRRKFPGSRFPKKGGYSFEFIRCDRCGVTVRRGGVDNIVLSITQKRSVQGNDGVWYYMSAVARCFWIWTRSVLRYAIRKPIDDPQRLDAFQRFIDGDMSSAAVGLANVREPIAHLHLTASR